MKTWEVTLPIVGTAFATVTAETESEAIEAAMDVVRQENIEEWQAVHYVVRGNVCYAPTREAFAEEIGPE